MPINGIKSSYFIIILFSHLSEEIKLKIVKYNKNYQHLLNIKLINYKIFSGRYIEYESNGKVREYDSYDDHLIYEGEYLNGKRNGKGKEYDKYVYELMLFEGNYLNGKRNGEGKEYYDTEDLKFKGEYLNGKKWNGKGYDRKGYILYELKNGNGFVREYDDYDYGLVYEGEYGYGIGFDGELLNGKKWNGKLYDIDGNLICELKWGKGLIKMYNRDNILISEGQLLNGVLNGIIKEYDDEGKIKFEGEVIDGKRNGKVKKYYNGKLKFEGEYLYDHKIKGKEYINGILEYEGEFLFDKKWNGKGYDEKGNIIYELINGNGKVKEYNINNFELEFEGDYLNGQRNGKGKEYYFNNKLKFEGEYLNGKRNGKGKEYYYNGNLKFEGEYLNGIRWKGKNKEYGFYGKLIFEGEYLGDYRKKGKEYDNGILEYEGEYYKEIKWTGKGYDEKGNIIYELNNGKGRMKEYGCGGKLKFEGEYLNGKRNGKGKEYINEKLIFEGEYLNGKRWNGKGIQFDSDTGFEIEIEYLNGEKKIK